VTTEELAERLAQHRLLSGAPREELRWIAEHAQERRFARGEVAAAAGQPLNALWIVLSGHISIRFQRGGTLRKMMEWRGGDVSGLLPYSRLDRQPGEALAEEPTEAAAVSRDHFPEMIRQHRERSPGGKDGFPGQARGRAGA
jgi:CRP-like cAMP-binding protein